MPSSQGVKKASSHEKTVVTHVRAAACLHLYAKVRHTAEEPALSSVQRQSLMCDIFEHTPAVPHHYRNLRFFYVALYHAHHHQAVRTHTITGIPVHGREFG